MPNAKLELVEDVSFILSEVARFAALQKQWFETKVAPDELREGFLWELPHPTDKHKKYPCGRVGMRRLEKLSHIAAERAGISRQIDILTIRQPLAKSIVRRFLIEGRALEISQVERALSEAARMAKRSMAIATHFVPCHLMTAQSPAEFAIGPVKFIAQKHFRKLIAERIWRQRKDSRRSAKFLLDVTRYYKSFGWVAEVTIKECDEKTSERQAVQAVTYALDCLQLFFGPSHTSRMTVGGPGVHVDRRGRLYVEEDSLKFSASYGGPGEVGFENDWTKFFIKPDGQHLLKLFGAALQGTVDPTIARPLSERFLDAVSWYGEATRERVIAAKIVKYVTALERMLMTDERDNITDLVSRRAAAFCSDPRKDGDFAEWQSKAQRAYALRSKLVHGSISQRDLQVSSGAHEVQEVVQASILNSLSAMGEPGLLAEDVGKKALADWFNGIIAHTGR